MWSPKCTGNRKSLEYKMGYSRIKASYLKATVHILSNNRNWFMDMPVTGSLSAGSIRTRGSTHKGSDSPSLQRGQDTTATKVITAHYNEMLAMLNVLEVNEQWRVSQSRLLASTVRWWGTSCDFKKKTKVIIQEFLISSLHSQPPPPHV